MINADSAGGGITRIAVGDGVFCSKRFGYDVHLYIFEGVVDETCDAGSKGVVFVSQ